MTEKAHITIISVWEDTQMSPITEWRMWRQLKGAYQIDRIIFTPISDEIVNSHINVEQYETMEEALSVCSGEFVFLEPYVDGAKPITEIPKGDITLVLGSTNVSNAQYINDNAYIIDTPKPVDFYGINAVGIALSHRYYK